MRYDNELEKCIEILKGLASKSFSPALLTLGDMKLFQNDKEGAVALYKSALKLRNIYARPKVWKLKKDDASFFAKVGRLLFQPLLSIKSIFLGYVMEERGEKYCYHDFYFLGYTVEPLNTWWADKSTK